MARVLIVSEERTALLSVTPLFVFLILFTGQYVVGDSLESDKQVLLDLRSFLEDENHVNRGTYTQWSPLDSSRCSWSGISCNSSRVTGINLSNENIGGNLFGNFSALSQLTTLDLSGNTIGGSIPPDLGQCQNLKFLNLSHNLIEGELNLSGLDHLEIIDLSVNRISGDFRLTFPSMCQSLVVANISLNNLTGEIGNSFDKCWQLEYVDLSSNFLSGNINLAFQRLKELEVSNNSISGTIQPWVFSENCSLEALDLSENLLIGEFPKEISHCKNLVVLNLWGNSFTGVIPPELGSILSLEALLLGNNKFSDKIPESLVGLNNLVFLDLSKNNFGGDIQEVLGRMTQVKYLLLNGNSYTGGLFSSGILNLSNIVRLDLSYNNLSGQLPIAFIRMTSLKYLFLAFNQFSGNIPLEYGNFPQLQALDLSYNMLSGSIPPTLGKLSSLLWLMLADNNLTGEIPPELGNCSSLLWLNFANNQISGKIPPELANIGKNATPTFLMNRINDRITAGSGDCSAMKRWIPADYPPFSFVYTLLTVKKCRSLWDMLLKGHGLFPVCAPGSNVQAFQISGYILLVNNLLSGEIPPEFGKMQNLSMLQLGFNNFYGTVPEEIAEIPLVVLNITQNKFSGKIPDALGSISCLRNLDLSYNNFSGVFPTSLNNLNDLSSFNVSYNPYITGLIPETGQLATFEKSSFLGDPLLSLPPFIGNNTKHSPDISAQPRKNMKFALVVLLALTLTFFVCGAMSLLVCIVGKVSEDSPGHLLEDIKERHDTGSVSDVSLPWFSDKIKVIRLDKTEFTHKDIFVATGYFSNDRIIGRGGFGTVYKGVLPDGREVAVKKQQREGPEGEREFRAEMEVLTGNGFSWPHPNLVTLYGWCLDGSEKLLVYEYMEVGSLEELILDRTRLTWRRRIDVALDVAHALVFLHHECFPLIVHRDVKASNVLLDKDGKARVTDFGLARVVDAGGSHVSTMVAGTVGYVAPEYGQTWQATTKGDVYSYGVLVMELATGRRAVDGGEECLVEWERRVMRNGQGRTLIPVGLLVSSRNGEGAEELCELLRIGIRCAAETPQARPNMKEVLVMLIKISSPAKGI